MKSAFVAAALCAAATTAAASNDGPLDVRARARAASAIVVATVTDVESSRFDTNQFGDRLIVTRTWLRIEEVVKGRPQPVVALDIEGGTVGDLTLHVSDMPALRRGDRAVFFLSPGQGGAYTPNGRGRGVLKVDTAGRTANGSTLADVKAAIRAALQ